MSISALWAKKQKDAPYWLPLNVHLKDTAEIAQKLWSEWLSDSVKRVVIDSIKGSEEDAIKLIIFLCVAHDFGKATPVFQATRSFPPTDLDHDIFNRLNAFGLSVLEGRDAYREYRYTPHALASQLLLENASELGLSTADLSKNVSVILGAHHGKPPDTGYSDRLASMQNLGLDDKKWKSVQSELVKFILDYSGYNSLSDLPTPSMSGQVLLSGLVIVADWLSSNSRLFPLMPFDLSVETDSHDRADEGWSKLNMPGAWDTIYSRYDEGLYRDRFVNPDIPNSLQKAALKVANNTQVPGIIVIEAPMGSGKTEAALAVAEVFRNRAGSGGIFFALPTQATSDGIFPRVLEWMNRLDLIEPQSVKLAHGKAQYNEDFSSLQMFSFGDGEFIEDDFDDQNEENQYALSHQWFSGRKKSMLANFVVGTIDQLLMMALKQKHVMLRHLGFAGKIVIIDECHAYDAYMNQYLKTALTWLGYYKVPVIVLSATLTKDIRREVVGAYLGDDRLTGEWVDSQEYPLITYTDGCVAKSHAVTYDGDNRSVKLGTITVDKVTEKLEELLSGGGCAGIIMSTVRRAQDMADALRVVFGSDNVLLIHSRFISDDRLALERRLRDDLGREGKRPEKIIVVGTQVLEQSLDIDFDLMITDIAPMDLLLQRVGRLHRHQNKRPQLLSQPMCFITGIEEDGFSQGIDRVYAKHLLMRTLSLLISLNGSVSLPGDIAGLVNAAYDKNAPHSPEKEKWEKDIHIKESKASSFKMSKPLRKQDKNIINWLNTDVDDANGEASVRDTYDAIEVLVVRRAGEGYSMLNGQNVPIGELEKEMARMLARQSISFPQALSNTDVVEELRKSTKKYLSSWQSSPWISGELFLILDESNSATLCGRRLVYSKENGLIIEREKVSDI